MTANVLSALFTAKGNYRMGFILNAAIQPAWFALGYLTGVWANSVLAIFFFAISVYGLLRESMRQGSSLLYDCKHGPQRWPRIGFLRCNVNGDPKYPRIWIYFFGWAFMRDLKRRE
jgi:hypothetical protein